MRRAPATPREYGRGRLFIPAAVVERAVAAGAGLQAPAAPIRYWRACRRIPDSEDAISRILHFRPSLILHTHLCTHDHEVRLGRWKSSQMLGARADRGNRGCS